MLGSPRTKRRHQLVHCQHPARVDGAAAVLVELLDDGGHHVPHVLVLGGDVREREGRRLLEELKAVASKFADRV